MFAATCAVTVGDGNRVSFWYDSWLPEGAPLVIAPDLFKVSRRKVRSVRQALLGSRWIQDLRGRVTTDLLPSFVRLWACVNSRQPLSPGTMDSFRWRLTENGVYTTASAYRLFFIGSTIFPLCQEIWKAWAPAKLKMFAWLLHQNRLWCNDLLQRRGWPNSYFCQLCLRNLETAVHQFWSCPFAKTSWTSLSSWQHCQGLSITCEYTDSSSLDMMEAMVAATQPVHAKGIKSLIMLVLWKVWQERNSRVFRKQEVTAQDVIKAIRRDFCLWQQGGFKHIQSPFGDPP